ncbi:MAG: hypothetical protein JXR25_14290 [Pontiellaceae bacterium]|nr:hypothetical protein [Pontiellaceae bacterium]MBN2785988.1 hypothetical protein [Pontiellaceae bacterium]
MKKRRIAIFGFFTAVAMTGVASNQNLLLNGDFNEDDGVVSHNAAYWNEYNSNAGGWVNRETAANGTYGSSTNVHYAMGASGSHDAYVWQDVAVPDDGSSYVLSVDSGLDAWWKNSGYLRLEFYDAETNWLDEVSTLWEQANYDAGVPWAAYSVTNEAPLGTVLLRVVMGSTGEGGTARFDNAVLEIYDPVSDSDGDGLPDYWEYDFGLDPFDNGSVDINNGANGDPDGDTLVNSAEFALNTDPTLADTDGDDLSDAEEANTYETDPLHADTDGDYLSDGDEVNIHSTDPLNADSDSDDVNDATEIYAGSNPEDAASMPANNRPELIGLDGFDYTNGAFTSQVGGELFDYDNSISNDLYTGHTGNSSTWDILWGTPTINSGTLYTPDAGVYRSLNGAATGGEDISLFSSAYQYPEVDNEVLYAKVDMQLESGVSWGGLSLFATDTEEIYFGMSTAHGYAEFAIDESGTDTTYTSISMTNGVNYTMVIRIDGSDSTASIWIDPDLSGSEPDPDALMTVSADSCRCSAIRLASGGTIRWDNLVVGTTWDVLSTTTSDSDGDGLPDAWENTYGLDPNDSTGSNGADGDMDSDNLTNLEEFTLGTSPISADSDNDGLSDDEEANTYITNPLDDDSDDDGLSDGDEVNTHGTNPLNADSDDDGESDSMEIEQGTDPMNPESSSAALGLVVLDGILDRVAYGDAVATQNVNTTWADNTGELDAAYALVQNGRLYLFLSGNIDEAWNKLHIFIDSSDAVTTNVLTTAGNSDSDRMDGLTFDEGFSPDYHINIRRGTWSGGGALNLDMANLATGEAVTYDAVFGALTLEGIAYTGTNALVNAGPIGVAYNNSNTNGVVSGTDAADPAAALAAMYGLELSFDLADLGDPSGSVRICAMICEEPNTPISNQILGGVPPEQDSLGAATNVDFNAYAGDQFFTVNIPHAMSTPMILSAQLVSGGTAFELSVGELSVNVSYQIQETDDLTAGFSDVPDSSWTASEATETVTVPADTDANPAMFYRVVAP